MRDIFTGELAERGGGGRGVRRWCRGEEGVGVQRGRRGFGWKEAEDRGDEKSGEMDTNSHVKLDRKQEGFCGEHHDLLVFLLISRFTL